MRVGLDGGEGYRLGRRRSASRSTTTSLGSWLLRIGIGSAGNAGKADELLAHCE